MLVTGSWAVGHGFQDCELLPPGGVDAGSWGSTGALLNPRTNHTSTLLEDFRLLLVGGELGGSQGATRTCEITTTPVTAVEHLPVPDLVLLGAVPNPVHGRTAIVVRTGRAGILRISLHDVSGSSVLGRIQRMLEGGEQRIPVDLTPLTPGIYLCRVSVAGRSAVLKLLRY